MGHMKQKTEIDTKFGNEALAMDPCADDRLAGLRVNFGLPDCMVNTFLRRDGLGRRIVRTIVTLGKPALKILFSMWLKLPRKFTFALAAVSWKLWVVLHKILPASLVCHGCSDSLSIESHAMHNVQWFSRLVPPTIWMARFGLSQISICNPPSGKVRTEWIEQSEPGLCGAYLHILPPSQSDRRVLLWVFGGAFLGGDVVGNMGLAEHWGHMLHCDVFVADMRLCPEHQVQDAVFDLYRAYEWLLTRVSAERIMLLGISSGAGCCVRTLQLAAASEQERQEFFGDRLQTPSGFTLASGGIKELGRKALPQPAGCILLGPFVEYSRLTPSMQQMVKVDWIVTQGVVDLVMDSRETLAGGVDNLKLASPIHNSSKGLCPLVVSVSEHECLIDEDREFVRGAKVAGVDVELQIEPHMCHVFQVMSYFLPEAKRAEARIVAWVKSKGGAWA